MKLRKAVPRSVFFGVFAISGFSGLIYESIWSHYLKLFLGHAAYAQSLVLIIFMGGLALGSWLAANVSERWRAPILAYAVVEAVIGVIALLFHDVFVSIADAFHSSVLPSIDSATLGNVLKWASAAALIVPQSVLLGMTFPLMSTGILRRYPDQPGGSLGMLYFTNSIGAALGVLASGFWLIGVFGLPGTIMTAGLLNIALALAVWTLVKLDPQPFAPPLRPSPAAATGKNDDIAVLFFFAAALTGASSFMYEIGWIRMLSLVLGATTHSFELMLSAFITGLAFGGLWIKRRVDRIADPIRFSGWVQILMGVLAALTLPLYVETFDWMAALLGALQRTDSGYVLFTAFSHGIALLVMVPTTFLAGMTLPLFTYVLLRGRQGERAIGRVYASNTLGAILGVLFAVHIGLPLLGLKNLIGLAAVIDMLLGLVLLYRAAGAHKARELVPGGLLCAGVLVVVSATVSLDPRTLGSGVYRNRTAQLSEAATVVYYRDGKTASISLTAQEGRLSITTNGKIDASIQMDPQRAPTADEITMVMAAALPLAYKPDARRVANIGLGSGLTTHTFLGEPSIERVDTIEIEPFMVEAAQGFGERVARTFGDPRSSIHVEDAKTFFSLQNETYDIIVAEPSNPWVSGVASLFSDEFYRLVPRYLSDDGLFVQWLQLYEFNDDLALSVLKALSANFSDYAIYNTDNTDILIVAKHTGSLATPDFTRIVAGALKPDLAHVGLHSASDFVVRSTGTKPLIESLIAHSVVPMNSDFYPFLDLNAGRARFRTENAALFYAWSVAPLPLLEMLGMDSALNDTIAGNEGFQRTLLIAKARGLYAHLKGVPPSPDATAATQHDTILAALLRTLGESCGGSQSEEQWLDVLHTLSVTSLPFLDPARATDLLDTVVPPACAEQRSSQFRAWLKLYHAVAARNTTGMAAAAAEILDSPGTEPAKASYALAAAMLGRLADRQPREALGVWEQHAAAEAAEKQPDLRLLLSTALQRHGETVVATGRSR
jgi:predicted membrane-bound spermidine synthase